MSLIQGGFYIERLAVVGKQREDAELNFSEGLNVVSGPSDTGKTFALSCIDFAFGATKPPRSLPESEGYEYVLLRLVNRVKKTKIEIKRSLAGGNAEIVRLKSNGELESKVVVRTTHNDNPTDNLSGILLSEIELFGKRVRTAADGSDRNLSFRDIAFLSLIDEERIIAERSPHLSGQYTKKTAETSVFKLLASGADEKPVLVDEKSDQSKSAAMLELIDEMIKSKEAELAELGFAKDDIEIEIERIEEIRQNWFSELSLYRQEIYENEQKIAATSRRLSELDSRSGVVENLLERFTLLSQHYESDIDRLLAIKEAGTLLAFLPSAPCVVCGAMPENQNSAEASEQFRSEEVSSAATREIEKLNLLNTDLKKVLIELNTEFAHIEDESRHLKGEVRKLESAIKDELRSKEKSAASNVKSQDDLRDRLHTARGILLQITQLSERAESLESSRKPEKGKRKKADKVKVGASTADMANFALEVEALLSNWRYPNFGRVSFSEDNQDIVVSGQPRTAHGKGVRALTCSAYIVGLMRLAAKKNFPHLGIVALDSPLVSYREPDEGIDAGDALIHKAGVKEAFYRSLGNGDSGGQIIIFENEDPPSEQSGITIHRFSKSQVGRYGFFPVLT